MISLSELSFSTLIQGAHGVQKVLQFSSSLLRSVVLFTRSSF